MVERVAVNHKVIGSSPIEGDTKENNYLASLCSSGVEQRIENPCVIGSNPIRDKLKIHFI